MNRTVRLLTPILALLAVLALPPATARAAVPSPSNSTVPRCLTICPSGDRAFSITVRDVANVPVGGATVVLDLAPCAGVRISLCDDCPQPSGYDPALLRITRPTNAAGVATFQLCGSIFCPGSSLDLVEVRADGVLLGRATFNTPDLDADRIVGPLDVEIATSGVGGNTYAADQDCDRDIDAVDVALVTAHGGHMCATATGARDATWGTIKSLYR